jgi:gamma-glutamyl-gamma-aminobutyrate hydrolase PuuD
MRLVSAIYRDFGPFENLSFIDSAITSSTPATLTKDDVLLLHGGADISPSLYGHVKHRMTYADEVPSQRDVIEWSFIQRAKELNIPIIGICRGAQMLCAAAGGYLIQHVDNHGSNGHNVICSDGEVIRVNSCHHQMMYPFDVEHEMLMWTEPLSKRHLTGNGTITVDVEPETVYYPKLRAFAPQWHPEWLDDASPANLKLLSMIEERI